MKKHIKQCAVLFLACAIAVLQPAHIYAEEESGQSKAALLEEMGESPQENDEGAQPEADEDTMDEGNGGSPKEAKEGEPETDGSSIEEPETDGSGADQDAVDASGQKGEVTEPITKEDKPYLALGANLTQGQKNIVLSLLGINPAELEDYDVIYITNEEEHQYLGEYVAADKIGTRSLSSVLVVKRDKGNGINITTKNISYCTIGMYKNALITAGITDADIIVAGPSPISGTAALVGVMKAYSDMTGEKVTEQSMDTALNELVLTGDLADTVGDSEKAEELN